jgi:hypothetical protein
MRPWELVACFVAPFGMIVPALFDDGRNRPTRRIVRVLLVAVAFAFIWAVVASNIGMVPSIGHLAGVWGILQYNAGEVCFKTVFYTLGAFPFFFCFDRVAADCWGWVRQFRDVNGKPSFVKSNLSVDM